MFGLVSELVFKVGVVGGSEDGFEVSFVSKGFLFWSCVNFTVDFEVGLNFGFLTTDKSEFVRKIGIIFIIQIRSGVDPLFCLS